MFRLKINCPAIYCENSKTVLVGRSSGSYSHHIACFSIRTIKTNLHWRACHFWGRFCHHFYAGSEIHTHETVSFSSYSVGAPTFQDTIQKEFVFKLSFKNHVYFFRADSEHTYNRWMEVLKSTTQTQDFKNTRTAHWLTDKKISKISWCLKYFYFFFLSKQYIDHYYLLFYLSFEQNPKFDRIALDIYFW